MESEISPIICKIRNGVARITLNRPPLNILDIDAIGQLQGALARVEASSGVKVLAIDHQGKAFSAGVSIKDHAPDRVAEMLEKFHGMIRQLSSLAVPSVALVDGPALGGGCELAILCDMVIASERATFGQPEIKVGVFPPIAAVVYPHLIGRNRTLEMLLTGDVFGAADAKAMGLVNKVLPVSGFRENADEFVAILAALSGPVLKLTKRAVDTALQGNVIEGIEKVERLYLDELMQTEDAREGLNAFLEKRKPVWREK